MTKICRNRSLKGTFLRDPLCLFSGGKGEGWLNLNRTCGKSCSYTACLLVINNSIMFPWVPLFAFERGSITFPDCNACKQMQVGSVYICTLSGHVFPLLTSYIMLGRRKLFLTVNQDERKYISCEKLFITFSSALSRIT